MAPAGTPVTDLRDAEPMGYISADGIEYNANGSMTIDEIDALSAEEWHRANPPIRTTQRAHQAFTFTMTGQSRRRFNRLIWGIYRARGDKPLIHNGKKHR